MTSVESSSRTCLLAVESDFNYDTNNVHLLMDKKNIEKLLKNAKTFTTLVNIQKWRNQQDLVNALNMANAQPGILILVWRSVYCPVMLLLAL